MTQGWSVDLLVTIFVKYVTIFLFYLECHLYKGRESPKDIIQFGMFYIAIFFYLIYNVMLSFLFLPLCFSLLYCFWNGRVERNK